MPRNTNAPAEPETALATIQAQTALETIKETLANVPQADEDPTERMAKFIINQPAEKWDELWAGLPSIREYKGRVITVHDMRARESDFEGPLGLYLILDATDNATGEKVLISCSSQMSMVQLVTLRKRGQLPVKVEVVEKDKPTKAGFRPIHLRYIGAAGERPLGDPGAVVSEQ
jgi:hypothetical protein